MIQVSGKGKGKASYQVDYTPLSPKDLENEMRKEISHVAGALSLKVSIRLRRSWFHCVQRPKC